MIFEPMDDGSGQPSDNETLIEELQRELLDRDTEIKRLTNTNNTLMETVTELECRVNRAPTTRAEYKAQVELCPKNGTYRGCTYSGQLFFSRKVGHFGHFWYNGYFEEWNSK